MKTVLCLAALVAVALGGTVPSHHDFETKPVDQDFIYKQKKVFELLRFITQVDPEAEYYKFGYDYDIEANLENYTNKKAVEEFLLFYRHGFLPKGHIFSVFYEKMREEAIALYHLFYYAKDFETFYKTAAWARVHLNEGLFSYAYSIAILHRADTKGIILPAPYEIYPYYFVNSDVIARLYRVKMQNGIYDPAVAAKYGIVFENDSYNIYANYSGWYNYDNEEQKLTYFTEDIGLNSYYYYFHTVFPFWMTGEEFPIFKERRGEAYYYFHQQLLARFYMERLTNGLGEIPEFSWRFPLKTGYQPDMIHHSFYPFAQRADNYNFQQPENVGELEFLESYENQFFEYLQQGHFKAYNSEVDFRNSKAVNFVSNYFQSNADLYEKFGPRNYDQYYDIIARVLLGATPESNDKYYASLSALEQFETSLRDPVFFQFYKRVMYYFLQYKQYLEPYTREQLHFVGVKISDVKVDPLVTYFDFYTFDATNALFYSKEQLKTTPYDYKITQPRLNHKNFNVNIEVKSDVNTEAMFKIFFGPKYDSKGFPISLEENWMNFVELDWFKYKLVPGKNSIVRNSEDFWFYKDEPIATFDLMKMLESSKVPVDMSENFYQMPYRLMLPKGTKGGFPFQFFVMVYPYTPLSAEYEPVKEYLLDNKPFGYPFDRPVDRLYFYQPNMFFEDVLIYHEGEDFYYKYNIPGFKPHKNEVHSH